jgi:hypothetical protein
MYDYIIIGGGIAGLTIDYHLSNKYKTLLLEKNKYLGGRGIEGKFHNNIIKLGAGIGASNNKHLLHLLRKLKISYDEHKSNINLLFDTKFNMRKNIKKIKNKYKILKNQNNKDVTHLNVKKFIIKYFGRQFFKQYDRIAEYKDYHDSDLEYYIKYYPINDHIPSPYKLLSISWTELINKLTKYIRQKNKIKLNYNLQKIIYDKNKDIYIIDNKYYTKNIIFAVTIDNLQKILNKNKIIDIDYSRFIGSIPFLRIYSHHKDGHNLKIDRYNIIDNELEKIIVISDKILMISYCDNQYAKYWYNLYKNNKNNTPLIIDRLKALIKKTTNQNIEIDDIKFVYWTEGIHYFNPQKNIKLKKLIKLLSNPRKNIYVCGEMLSYRQGWVEGAVESANRIYNLINHI